VSISAGGAVRPSLGKSSRRMEGALLEPGMDKPKASAGGRGQARDGQIIAHKGEGEGRSGLRHASACHAADNCRGVSDAHAVSSSSALVGATFIRPTSTASTQPWRHDSLGLALRMPSTCSYTQSGAWQSQFCHPSRLLHPAYHRRLLA
jgi:hypothetical protein